MPGRLIEQTEAGMGVVYPLNGERTTIGREEDNTLALTDDGISRHHAEVRWDGARYVLVDLDSKNGTWLNGDRVEAPRPLRHGDVITLPCRPPVRLRYEVTKETVTVAPEIVVPVRSSDELRVDTRTAEVWVRGERVMLTAKEYQVLTVLFEQDGALVTKHDLAARAWPEYNGAVGNENIEQMISRLRRKLERDPDHPRHLITVRGLGYRLLTR